MIEIFTKTFVEIGGLKTIPAHWGVIYDSRQNERGVQFIIDSEPIIDHPITASNNS
jgi:hypothetical protein